MNAKLQAILNKYQEFIDYTNNIGVDFRDFSRKELMEFNDSLREIQKGEQKIWNNNLTLINAKKLEEFPVLTGVHHYPVINELEFLTKEQRIELDKYLNSIGCGRYAIVGSPLFRGMKEVLGAENTRKAFDELFKKGVVDKVYTVPFCCDENTRYYPSTTMNNIIKYYDLAAKKNRTSEEEKWFYDMKESVCDEVICQECGSDEIECFEDEFRYSYDRDQYDYKVLLHRDTTYDNL